MSSLNSLQAGRKALTWAAIADHQTYKYVSSPGRLAWGISLHSPVRLSCGKLVPIELGSWEPVPGRRT